MGYRDSGVDDMPDHNWWVALVLGAVTATLTAVAASEPAVIEPEFGINRGALAFDGACNDPRFVTGDGPDTGNPSQIFGDAADCHAAWQSGEIVLRQTGHYLVSRMAAIGHLDNDLGDLDQPSGETGDTLGEDRGPWSSDGVCNDPRFAADPRWPGAVDHLGEAEGRDSTDCLLAYLSRQAWPIRFRSTDGDGLVFGDDSGEWAGDGECDDPRFIGVAAAESTGTSNLLRDASDCHEAWTNGHVTLILPAAVLDRLPAGFDLGGDTGEWAFDSECDDPRFEGAGMALDPLTVNLARDATDCVKGLLNGAVELKRPRLQDGTVLSFGGNAGEWAGNGVCNDPRFEADPRSPDAALPVDNARHQDGADCEQEFLERRVWPAWAWLADSRGLVFGDDSGEWAGDGECDDPRFFGVAGAESASASNLLRDASDCHEAWADGRVTLVSPVALLDKLPAGFDLGRDTSEWAFDGECDDPRFHGEHVASELHPENQGRDATDCGRAFLKGTADIRTQALQ